MAYGIRKGDGSDGFNLGLLRSFMDTLSGYQMDDAMADAAASDALNNLPLNQQNNLELDDLSTNPLTVNPLLAQDAANTGPFVTDPAAGADTLVVGGDSDTGADDKETGVSSETAEQILAKYKDRADPVTDMLGDYKQEDGSIFPVNVLLEIISDYAVNRDNKDAQAILGTWNKKIQDKINQPAIDAFIDLISGKGVTGNVVDDTVGAVNGAASGAAGGAAGGAVAGGATGGATSGATSGATAGGGSNDTLSGGNGNDTINNDNNTDKDISVISGGSVLDQTGTGDVNVDDKPEGLLNIPTSIPKQPEKKAGMIMQISQSAPIVETVFDDILFEPKFTKLDNIPDFNLPSGLLRTLV